MLYVFAIIGLVTLTTLFWRAFGPESINQSDKRVLGPDDDPEFMRRLGPGAPGPRD